MSRFHGPAEGHWSPLQPHDAAKLLAQVTVPWWIAGGWALDLFLGSQTRAHDDLDVGVLRRDVIGVIMHLPGWEFFEAHSHTLYRLEVGERPRPEVSSLWCRPAGTEHWALELMLDDAQGEDWVFRRSSSVRLPLHSLINRTAVGIPYLRPQIQLLYKARHPRPKDYIDFEHVLRRLSTTERAWLGDALCTVDPNHPWLTQLRN